MKRFWPALLLTLAGCVGPGPDIGPPPDDPAVQLVERLREKPDDLEAAADLLRLQLTRNDEAGAQLTVDHLLHHSAADFRAQLLAAQLKRWQFDLLGAETHLRKAGEMAPANVEPRVALAALYRDAALDAEELAQRENAIKLADAALKPELELDAVYALAGAGRLDEARKRATALAESGADGPVRAQALLLVSELALDAGDDAAAVTAVLAARKLAPLERNIVRYAARLAGALNDPSALRPLFDDVLATQEDPESRFAALFGAWTAAVRGALAKGENALGAECEALWRRLNDIDAGQPDALARRYLVLKVVGGHDDEAKRVSDALEQARFSAPHATQTTSALLRLWRAEECLRLGAAQACLIELDQLMPREPSLTELKFVRVTALFVARDDARCLDYLGSLLSETGGKGDDLLAMRGQLLLRLGRAPEVVRDLEASPPQSASGQWLLAVARFHTYRKQG